MVFYWHQSAVSQYIEFKIERIHSNLEQIHSNLECYIIPVIINKIKVASQLRTSNSKILGIGFNTKFQFIAWNSFLPDWNDLLLQDKSAVLCLCLPCYWYLNMHENNQPRPGEARPYNCLEFKQMKLKTCHLEPSAFLLSSQAASVSSIWRAGG